MVAACELELATYKQREGIFTKPSVLKNARSMRPAVWWDMYCKHLPILSSVATTVLAQVPNLSNCLSDRICAVCSLLTCLCSHQHHSRWSVHLLPSAIGLSMARSSRSTAHAWATLSVTSVFTVTRLSTCGTSCSRRASRRRSRTLTLGE